MFSFSSCQYTRDGNTITLREDFDIDKLGFENSVMDL